MQGNSEQQNSNNQNKNQYQNNNQGVPFQQKPMVVGQQLQNVKQKPVVAVATEMNMTKMIFRFAIAIIVLALVVWIFVVKREKSSELSQIDNAVQNGIAISDLTSANGSDTLSVPTPQDAGMTVLVSSVVVSLPTWVVIYEDINGKPGNVLGAGLFSHGRESGSVELLRETLHGKTYYAGQIRDDGDMLYSVQNDVAVRDADGNLVLVQFKTR